ncbi:MAG: hypothetical protein COY38_01455 [Candidatus Aenigmarchaeota archaeon CG_4_10_14_0_8_um_filter_37_24]|nr:AbrB/MazE/SpoVT family DNA-binding domain-containing protein [Candidatus Aenigmarchaeota archaeon]OIN88543.1 MAG: hypothetical protein AUJ50_00720 [Candidatus Aenigmarchaeota archaeon CG1_02_38_14]PIV68886.1 MAG: hypothetical protein COS07_02805 [Candidatus Aenigmarchaeota archaeon CG01_land_8_20_14_3_00_37_9]PIW41067.1 MAG: hypothetical protein COW21_03710 [Candidatus Aenigmarchaeota archaeon CG15_BIG_FIL_POST_REV_8_21_14_020_37_27]PIX50916.1 MAG: hypothetical protein COZ52_01510 [Candidatu
MVKDIEVINRELQIGGRITLPIEWRREMELRVGSEVIMSKIDHKIIIEPPLKITSLRGAGKTKKPSKDPKREARDYMVGKLMKELKK